MRVLFFILIVLSVSVAAQTPLVQKAFDEGTRLARNAEYEKAIENYQRAIMLAESEQANDELLARLHFNLGVCRYRSKQFSGAVEELEEAIKLSRRNYQKAFYALGMAHTELKNWRKARTAFRDAVSLEKRDGKAWFDLGLVYLEEKNYEAAEIAFQNSLRYQSVNAPDAHNNLGVIFALRGDFTAAEKAFRTALLMSKGESIEAEGNLRFCKFYRQSESEDLIAKLSFSK